MIARACTDEAEWDEFVRGVPWATAHHAFRYGRLLATCFGFLRPAYRLIRSGSTILAGVPLMEFSVGGLFAALQSLPFDMYGAPLIQPEHLEDPDVHRAISSDIDTQAARVGAFEARFRIPVLAPPAVRRCLEGFGHTESVPSDCPVLALDRPLEEIRRNYRPSVRRALQRSVKEGITVEAGADVARVREAYPLYGARMREIGATVKPWRFVEGIIVERIGTPFVAYHRGCPVGFLILLVTPAIATYWISAVDPSASLARPMNAIVDAAISWSHANHIPRFSFGESHGRPGLVRFKEGWGPGPGENFVTVRSYRPALQRAWRALEPAARRTYALWDRCWTSVSESGVRAS